MLKHQQELVKRASTLVARTQGKVPGAKAAVDDPWALAGKILDQGTGHDAFKVLSSKWDKVVQALGNAKKQSDNLRRVGVGSTEDPNLLEAYVIPAMEDYAETMDAVIKQLKSRVVEQSKHRL